MRDKKERIIFELDEPLKGYIFSEAKNNDLSASQYIRKLVRNDQESKKAESATADNSDVSAK